MNDNTTLKDVNKQNETQFENNWNVTAQVMSREYGFFQQNSCDSFSRDCCASSYMLKRMEVSHRLIKPGYGESTLLDFNSRGDILCAGYSNKSVVLWDWPRNGVKAAKTLDESTSQLCDLKYLNTNDENNRLNVISAHENGELRHMSFTPNGQAETANVYELSKEKHKLAICPEGQFEILSASDRGQIVQIDFRSELPSSTVNTVETGRFIKLHAISHHPLLPQVCCAYSDHYVRVFDKRKFDQSIYEICPDHLRGSNNFARDANCIYNFDGSEILAVYFDDSKIYLYNNESGHEGEVNRLFHQSGLVGFMNQINFFGPKSKYVIFGDDGQRVRFINKKSGEMLKCLTLSLHARFCSVFFLNLQPHPNLPVVATSVSGCNLKILSPASKKTDLAKV